MYNACKLHVTYLHNGVERNAKADLTGIIQEFLLGVGFVEFGHYKIYVPNF